MNGRAISQESFKYTRNKYNEPRYNGTGLCDTSSYIVRCFVVSSNSSPFTITFTTLLEKHLFITTQNIPFRGVMTEFGIIRNNRPSKHSHNVRDLALPSQGS